MAKAKILPHRASNGDSEESFVALQELGSNRTFEQLLSAILANSCGREAKEGFFCIEKILRSLYLERRSQLTW